MITATLRYERLAIFQISEAILEVLPHQGHFDWLDKDSDRALAQKQEWQFFLRTE
jgi:hypothetical protein